MRKRALANRWEALERSFRERRHSALLAAIVTAFVVRPLIGDTGLAPVVFSSSLLVLMLIALYNIQIDDMVGEREHLVAQRRRRSIIAWVLVAVAISERVAVLISPQPRLLVVSSICWLLFFGFVTWCELRSVLGQREVTGETISMSISVYLLLGLTWGAFYIVLYQVQPDAFSFGPSPASGPGPANSQAHLFPICIYFSLTTLATIGYGDITPLTLQARYAAVAEGITGQFYLAILVARLVSMHMSRAERQDDRRRSGHP